MNRFTIDINLYVFYMQQVLDTYIRLVGKVPCTCCDKES